MIFNTLCEISNLRYTSLTFNERFELNFLTLSLIKLLNLLVLIPTVLKKIIINPKIEMKDKVIINIYLRI